MNIIIYNIHFNYKKTQFARIQLKNHKSIFKYFNIFKKEINNDFKLHQIRIIKLLSKIYYISFFNLISKIIIEIIMNWKRIHDLFIFINYLINNEIFKYYKIIIYKIFQFTFRFITKVEKKNIFIKHDFKFIFKYISINFYNQWLFIYK